MTNSNSPAAFTYQPRPYVRRHGPDGYQDYQSYRPFLRDDFAFRCVYCLLREQWGRVSGDFDLDHFVSQAQSPEGKTDYDNLLYCCHRCNLRKGRRCVPDASTSLTSANVQVQSDGRIVGLTDDAKQIINVLELNSPKMVRWRLVWIRNIELARDFYPEHYQDLMCYPDDLPDLSKSEPPSNAKPEGIGESYFARRQRGELPAVYFF